MTSWKRVCKIPADTTSCVTALMYSSIISMFSVLNAAIAQSHPFLRLWSTITQWHLLGVVWLPDKLNQHKLFCPVSYWIFQLLLTSQLLYIHTLNSKCWYIFIYRPRTLFMTLSQRSLNHDFWLCMGFTTTSQCYALHFWRSEVILVTLMLSGNVEHSSQDYWTFLQEQILLIIIMLLHNSLKI